MIDDKDGHYIVKINENLSPRYKILRLLGQGTFGKVVECYDRVKKHCYAIKIIRAIQKYREASKIEIRVLSTIKEYDPLNLNKCIHLVEWFEHENHICMVFDLLGQSVFDFLKSNHFNPFPMNHIQHFAKQILTSIAFIHGLKLVHTDLKPENILLVDNTADSHHDGKSSDKPIFTLKNTEIRLIDFGSATFEKDYHSLVVSTRHYRAPEIILGICWSYPCDIWSIGCIIVEFITGDALFQTHDNLEHLAMMEVALGKIPNKMKQLSILNGQTYFKNNDLQYPTKDTTKQSKKYVKAMKPIEQILSRSKSEAHSLLLDLLKKMFQYDPHYRITATEALRHPFFQINI
ncbi:kinase-like domain-containing protein [Cunninghamella echinulata]|nr:kinase-like domain-containing protein [Cunninghamella echinulata]